MKKNKIKQIIIPIFLPQYGCKHRCVYCNQYETTLIKDVLNPEEVHNFIENELDKIKSDKKFYDIQIAFYGGSFTALSQNIQKDYLNAIMPFKEEGLIAGIRVSTRPDAISQDVLDNFKVFNNVVIEIGAQTFNDSILKLIQRNHSSTDIENAINLVKKYQFKVGIHLMVNLPGESPEMAFESANKVVKQKPDFVRIHPTLVFPNTLLETWFLNGFYKPWDEEATIELLIRLLDLFESNQIPVIRMGLQRAFKDRKPWRVVAGFDHPSLREIVETRRFFKKIYEKIRMLYEKYSPQIEKIGVLDITLLVHPDYLSRFVGYQKENRKKITELFPNFRFTFKADEKIAEGDFEIEIKSRKNLLN